MTVVALIYGGQSPEHEVSIVSARNVRENLLASGYEVVPVGIDRQGMWHVGNDSFDILSGAKQPANVASPLQALGTLKVDVVFPLVHGINGEDGMLAAFCQMSNLPFVGGDLLNGSLCWDKLAARAILQANGVPQLPFIGLYRADFDEDEAVVSVEKAFDYPVFVKPSRTGSSIGISRATDSAALRAAFKLAFEFDYRVIVEPGLDGVLEVEIAGLGALEPKLSIPARIIPPDDGFYDFEQKYLTDTTRFEIPAKLPENQLEEMHRIARASWKLLNCYGMARIDFLVTQTDVYLNEINTYPGFTSISMYPQLMERVGIPPRKLMQELVQLAMDRKAHAPTRTDFSSDKDWWKA